jgi:glycosyltransferase involved in cell wall biosynthesis
VGEHGGTLSHLASMPGVVVHGFVNDLAPFIADAAGLVVPLRVAGGTRIKILEAWAKGLPVVSTSIGAEGLQPIDGENCLLGDEPADLARACVRLLGDPQLGAALAAAGFEHGKRRFSWEAVHCALDPIIELALQARRKRARVQ